MTDPALSLTAVLSVLFAITLVVAMVWDLRKLEIPDTASVVLVGGFVGGILVSGHWAALPSHAAAGLTVFAAGAALFYTGIWGGGDVKLGGAIALWLGWGGLLPWLMGVALAGGALALVVLVLRRVEARKTADPFGGSMAAPGRGWAPAWLYDPDEGIPYGIALGIGALTLIERATVFAAG